MRNHGSYDLSACTLVFVAADTYRSEEDSQKEKHPDRFRFCDNDDKEVERGEEQQQYPREFIHLDSR